MKCEREHSMPCPTAPASSSCERAWSRTRRSSCSCRRMGRQRRGLARTGHTKLARHDDLRQLTDERSAQASLDSCHRESIPPARPVCTTPMASPGWAMERRNRGRPRCNRVRQGQRSCLPRFSSGAGDLAMDSTSTHTTGLCVARTRSKCRRVTLRSSIERSRTSRRIAARRTRHQARLEATGSR